MLRDEFCDVDFVESIVFEEYVRTESDLSGVLSWIFLESERANSGESPHEFFR